MPWKLFIIFFQVLAFKSNCQKIYTVVNLSGEFSGISYAGHHVKEEFRPSVPKMNAIWRIDFLYRVKRLAHKISLEQSVLGKNFKLINKFKVPPYSELGFNYSSYGTGIDHFIISYALQMEGKKEKGFFFKSRIKFNYFLGVGTSLNRSKEYYRDYYPSSDGGWSDPYTYDGYEAKHYREGMGYFVKGGAGFDLINKKNKRFLCFNLFYNQGLKTMIRYDVHYQYGYWSDPQRQVDVPHQILKGRGTTFGFSIGLPITIKK